MRNNNQTKSVLETTKRDESENTNKSQCDMRFLRMEMYIWIILRERERGTWRRAMCEITFYCSLTALGAQSGAFCGTEFIKCKQNHGGEGGGWVWNWWGKQDKFDLSSSGFGAKFITALS